MLYSDAAQANIRGGVTEEINTIFRAVCNQDGAI
jgi:hypothetical protein